MSKKSLLAVSVVVLAAAGFLVAQQQYPNLEEMPVVFENDHVVAQLLEFAPGEWSGEHAHAGNQLLVALDELKMMYRQGEEETERTIASGEVFWVDAVTHDHKALTEGRAILVTVK